MNFRIKTKNNNREVYTLWFPPINKWVTILKIYEDGKVKTSSIETNNIFDAGQNHLRICLGN